MSHTAPDTVYPSLHPAVRRYVDAYAIAFKHPTPTAALEALLGEHQAFTQAAAGLGVTSGEAAEGLALGALHLVRSATEEGGAQ
ncbi:hypothetical protein GCM10022279_30260 [Comamonas faecalis]|uniref:Uncharacterized protein n=1 Tax=Comamonas faecalis TaxID=1387849 RepID=A0ABP7RZD8_9BURK